MRRLALSKLQAVKTISSNRPIFGLAQVAHLLAQLVLAALVLILVKIDIASLAVALVLLAKWRMLAVRPRFWPANIRGNAVDIIVGLSVVVFVIHAPDLAWQSLWTALYAIWLIIVKPSDKVSVVSLQAVIGEFCGLVALFIAWGGAPLFVLALLSGLVCFFAARHFFAVFEEDYARLLAYLWATFAAATTWLLGHLLFFYGVINQPTLLLTVFGLAGATLYYLDHFDKSSKLARRQITVLVLIVIALIFVKLVPLMFYVWSDNVL